MSHNKTWATLCAWERECVCVEVLLSVSTSPCWWFCLSFLQDLLRWSLTRAPRSSCGSFSLSCSQTVRASPASSGPTRETGSSRLSTLQRSLGGTFLISNLLLWPIHLKAFCFLVRQQDVVVWYGKTLVAADAGSLDAVCVDCLL